MKTKLCVIFGGKSSEHDVSCKSAYNILKNLNKEKYDIIKFGITKEGATWLYTGDDESLLDGSWEKHDCQPCVISHCPKTEGLIKLTDGKAEKIKVDVFFPVLHGKNGEDGTIQGVFELAQIPYVGNGVAGSALCMDKIFTKNILECANIPVAEGFYIVKSEEKDTEKINERIKSSFGYPVVIKPSNAGSSVGVSLVEDEKDLAQAIKIAIAEDRRVLIERKIEKRELECAVLGNHNEAHASVLGEVITLAKMYDYSTKYEDTATKTQIPAEIDEGISDEIRKLAVKAFLACDCTGLARVDFFVEKGTNKIYLNEINTLPGFTNISMYPMLWGATGIPYTELLDKVIDLAIQETEA